MSARELANSNSFYNYQMKLARYKNKKVKPEKYISLVKNTRALLYARVLRAYERAFAESKETAMNAIKTVNAESSPKRLFEALKKLNTVKPVPKMTMAADLANSRTFSNFGKKMLKYTGEKGYAEGVVKAKALLAERVRNSYEKLSESQKNEVKKYVNTRAAMNKTSNPAIMFNALDEMNRYLTGSWRFL